ncbi:MAG: hypothetical protein GTO14_07570 [Anaerolineales bacterium]|nr:hypothetical protein [Anaerolineales bacterium]
MRLLDLYPLRGAYKPGEAISLEVTVEATRVEQGELRLTCYHLNHVEQTFKIPIKAQAGQHTLPITFNLTSNMTRGYGLEAELVDQQGQVTGRAATAFDVLESWLTFPRYGFLTDFEAHRSTAEASAWLARFHINGLQFYDWHYRHDHHVPPEDEYVDPLGRALSLETVREMINHAHGHGIAAMAYMAVYAASLPFAEQHRDWRLYDEHNQPINFEDFLGLMDPSANGAWVDHLIGECERTLNELPFDGLHVDQYGDPKEGFNLQGEPVDLPSAFQDFIRLLKDRFPEKSVTFNAVGNWPIEALAVAPQDFVYIEIWPPTPTYQDIYDVVRGARLKSTGKPVVVALYILVEHAANIRLADALIFASGGSRIELGEQGRLLTDPYFPNHQALTQDLNAVLRRYYDFAVRYGDLIGPSAAEIVIEELSEPDSIWFIPRRFGNWMALHLINFTGLEGAKWCERHRAPESLQELSISIPITDGIREVWWASPDGAQMALTPAPWDAEDGRIQVTIPSLDFWTMIVFEMGDDEA